jgi:peptide deformylase
MKPIVTVPNLVLTTPAKRVTKFDASIRTLIEEMKKTLLATVNPKGVGLAAPQIGVDLQVFITKPSAKAAIREFINPEILNKSDAMTNGIPERSGKLEGCLSIPLIWGNVKRSSSLTLRYQDAKGELHEEAFTGFLATIIQHETDHLRGILFTQRVLEQKEKLYQIGTDDDGKEVLDEIKLT